MYSGFKYTNSRAGWHCALIPCNALTAFNALKLLFTRDTIYNMHDISVSREREREEKRFLLFSTWKIQVSLCLYRN